MSAPGHAARQPASADPKNFALAPPAPPGSPLPERIETLRKLLTTSLDRFDERLNLPDEGKPTFNNFPSAALARLTMGDDPARAERYLGKMFKAQNMNTASPDFGGIPWGNGDFSMKDPNHEEFCLLPTGAVFLRFQDKFTPAFRQDALPHLKAGIAALRHHDVRCVYTNIFLMKMAALLLVGEAVNDSTAIQDAKVMLDTWIDFTLQNGTTEYDSSTYSAVDYSNLLMAYSYTGQQDIKAKLKACMDYFWVDLAANYYQGNQTLSGAQSRAYDFLHGDPQIDQLYYLVGLRTLAPTAPQFVQAQFSENVKRWTNAALGNYWPDAAILALSAAPERIIRQRLGRDTGQDRYNFVTPDFAIGSASVYHGEQDMEVSASLPSNAEQVLPFIEYTPDASDSPYGQIKVKAKDGHLKARKLKDLIASVQDKGVILALTDLGVATATEPLDNIATNLVVPDNADALYLDDQKVNTAVPFDLPVTARSVVFVRQGKAAIAVRIFAADTLDGQPPAFAFKNDGKSWNAARLVAYHYRGEAKRRSGEAVRTGFFVIATSCPDDDSLRRFMQIVRGLNIEQKMAGDQWSARLTYGSIKLEAGLDLKRQAITLRRVNGQVPPPSALELNGTDYAARLLGALPTPLADQGKYPWDWTQASPK